MEHSQWESVLVEWVNCLKQSDKIRCLQDLQDGVFFNSVYKVIKKSTEVDSDILTSIFDIISQHYPLFEIPNKSSVHLHDLSREDLIGITSLLMHYTCIHDRKNVLTSPMCYNLSQVTQIHIRSFLEKVNSNVTNSRLEAIISECIDEEVLDIHWCSLSQSPLAKNSPLQDLLKTPASKQGRLHEKDKEITQLKSELDVEKQEKQDLNKELQMLNERNSKLENQLHQKVSEVQRLRDEVLALESRTPPYYQDKDSRDIQKKLKMEIESLELYIQKSNIDFEELRLENDKATKTLRILEDQCTMWQNKFLEIEERFQNLTEHSKEQEIKNSVLQNHCKELESLLDEFRGKSPNESCLEESFQVANRNRRSRGFEPLQSYEDLAHSVVDVQLKEVQQKLEENVEELKKKEKIVQEMQINLDNITSKLEKTVSEKEQYLADFDEIQQKYKQVLNDLDISQEQLKIAREEIQVVKSDLEDKVLQLETVSEELNVQVLENEYISSELQVTSKQLEVKSQQIQELQNKLKTINTELDDIKKCLYSTLHEKDRANEKLEGVCKSLDLTYKKINNISLEKENLNKTLEITLNNHNDARNKLSEFAKKIESLEFEKTEILNKSNTKDAVIKDTSEKVEQLSRENREISEKLQTSSSNEKTLRVILFKLAFCIRELKLAGQEFIKDVRDGSDKFDKLVFNPLAYFSLVQENSILDIDEQHVHGIIQEISLCFNEFKEVIHTTLKKLQVVTEQNDVVVSESLKTSNTLEETTLKLENALKEIGKYAAENKLLKTDLKQTSENLNLALDEKVILKEELSKSNDSLVQAQIALDTVKSEKDSLSKNLDAISERLGYTESTLVENRTELNNTLQILQDTSMKFNLVSKEKEDISQELIKKTNGLTEYQTQLVSALREVEKRSEECSCLNSKLEELSRTIFNLQCEQGDTNKKLLEVQSNFEKAIIENENLLQNVDESSKNYSDLLVKLEDKDKMLQFVHKEKELIILELQKLTQELNVTRDERNVYYGKLELVVQELEQTKERVSQLEVMLQKCQMKLEETSEVLIQITIEKDNIQELLISKSKELEVALNELKTVSNTENHLRKCLEENNQNIDRLTSEKATILLKLEECIEQNTDFSQNLQETLSKAETLETHCTELQRQLEEIRNEKENLDQEKQQFSSLLEFTSQCLEKVSAEKETVSKTLEETATKLELVINEKSKISNNLEKSLSTLALIAAEKDKLLQSLEENSYNLRNISQEKDSFASLLEDTARKLEEISFEKDNLVEELKENKVKLKESSEENKNLSNAWQKVEEEKSVLSNFLDLSNSKLQKITDEKDEILAALEMSNKEVQKICSERNQLAEQVKNISVKKEQLQEEIQKSLKENKNLENKLSLKDVEISQLSKNVTDELTNNADLLRKNIDLAHTCERILKEKEDLKIKLEELCAERVKIDQKLQLFSKDKHNLISQVDDLEGAIKSLSEELEHLKKEKEEINSKLEIEIDAKTNIVQILEDTAKEKHDATVKVKKLCEEKKYIVKQLENTKLEKEQINEELLVMNSENKNLNREINKLKNERDSQVKEMESIWSRLQSEIEKTSDLVKNFEGTIQEKENALETLGTQKDEILAKIETISMENKSLLSDKGELSSKCHALLLDKEDIQRRLEVIFQEKDQLVAIVRDKKDALIKLESQQSDILEKLESITMENKALFNDKEKVSSKYHALVLEKQDIQCKLEVISQEKDQLIAIVQEKDTDIIKLKSQQTDVLEKLNTVTIENKALLNYKEEVSSKNQALLLENEDLQRQLCIISQERDKAAIVQEKESALISLEAQQVDLSEKLKTVTRQSTVLLSDNEAVSSKYNSLLIENENIQRQLAIISQEKNQLIATVQENEAALIKLESQLTDVLEKLEAVRKENKDLLSDKVEVSSMYQALLLEKENLQNELGIISQEKDQLNAIVQEKESTLINLEALQMKISEKLEAVTRENKDLREDNCKLKTENDDNHKKLAGLLYENEEIVRTRNAILEEKYDVCIKYEQLLKENQILSAEFKKVLGDKEEILNNLEKVIKEKEELFSELEKLSVNFDQVTKQTEEENKKFKSVESDYHDALEEIKQLARDRDEILELLTSRNNKIDELTKQNQQLRELLEQLENAKQSLILSLELSQKETQKVKKERNEILASQTKIMKDTEGNIMRAHENAVEMKRDLVNKLTNADKENEELREQLQKVREAYTNVVGSNSKYELENVNLRKMIEERNLQLNEYCNLKEAYEKLIEDNNKCLTEIDTLKYKRSRDREDFLSMLKKEKEEAEARMNKKIKEVRAVYEEKLEKMKDKMLKLYREEVHKEIQKVKCDQSATAYLQKTIDDLRNELFDAEQTIRMLEIEREVLRESQNLLSSRESLMTSHRPRGSFVGRGNKVADRESVRGSLPTGLRESNSTLSLRSLDRENQVPKRVRSTATLGSTARERIEHEKKTTTLPRMGNNSNFVEETITISRRTSMSNNVPTNLGGQNLEMEDEDDMFNNKYLTDLKEGRCIVPSGRESNVNRMSELARRNSLVPPHLKSSYPAEIQFVSPTRFKDDDIKTGHIELDDSLSKLLPGEKPRQRKDFGTTSYKKPGPPTPSKNGGRLSLQGNEIQPLKETNSDKTPKKVTPSRIKALFMGKNGKENAETVTPRTRRLSLFRKQK